MNSSVRIKRGIKSDLPTYLPLGEIVFCIDTHELYVGMGDSIPCKKASADIDLSEIGDITQLQTDNKTSLVGAINDLTKRLKYLEENGSLGGNNSAPIISSDFSKTVFSTDESITIPYYVVDSEGGKMSATYTVNGTISKADVMLGQNHLALGVLSKGSYTIKISVTDRGGLVSNELLFNIVVGALEISTTFDFAKDYTESDEIIIPYDVFSVDNSAITVEAVLDGSSTTLDAHAGRNTWRVGTLRKGVHTIKLVAFNGTVYSNEITANLVVADSGSLFISTDFNLTSIKATEKLTIPYRVSLLGGENIEIHKTINGVPQSVSVVGTGNNFWNVGNLTAGIYTITLQAKVTHLGEALESNILTITLTVEQTNFVPEQTVMNGLICWLDAKGKSNSDIDKHVWSDRSGNETPVSLHNINYMTNGWIDESLKLNGNSYVEIDLKPFETSKNLTIDVYFSFNNVGVTSARVISCEMPNQPKNGFSVDTDYAKLIGEQVGINQSPVLENKLTRATIVIDYDNEYPNSMLYMDGIVSNIVYLSPESNYVHNNKIYLGCQPDANGDMINFGECTIKTLRVYNRALSHVEVLQNHVADLPYDEQEAFRIRNEGKDIPTIEFFGSFEGMDADNQVPLRIKYLSNGYGTGINYDLPKCMVDWQGNSSLQYPIKNYNIDLYSEEYNADEGEYEAFKCQMQDNWSVQDSYHIKANLVDSSHAFNIGIAKFLDQVYTKPLPPMEEEGNPKNYRYAVDGFPVLMFINDAFHGVYTYNLKQHRDVFGLSKKNTAHVMFRAEENSKAGAGAFAKWEIEGATGIKGEWEQRHPKPGDREAYQELSNLIKWVATCSDEEFKTKIDNGCWIDKDFLLDYYIICYAFGMVDSLGKNMTITTWGAGKDGNPLWYPMFYDMDTAFGFTNNGALTWGPEVRCPEDYNTGGSLLWEKVMRVYGTRPSSTTKSEIEKRYEVLRNTRLTPDNVIDTLDKAIISNIPESFYNVDAINKYLPTGIDYVYMCKGNRLSHIKRWLTERFIYMDSKLNYSYSGNNRTIQFRSEYKGTIELWIKTYSPQLVSVDWGGTSLNIQTQMCNSETETRFYFTHDGTHKDFSITGANNILSIRGFKNKNLTMLNIGGASKLVELDCSQNPKLEGIDLSNAYYLRSLNVSNCGFVLANNSVLNVGACENLKTLEASGAGLTGVITTNCKYLEYVNLSNTKITSLNLSNFPMLSTLHISGCNRLARVLVRNNPNLDSLFLQNGESLEQVDASGCTKLRVFNFQNCPKLVDMNIDDCEELVTLNINKSARTETNIRSIDLSKNIAIETVSLKGNDSINEIKWGDNKKLKEVWVELTNVPEVDLSGCENVNFHAKDNTSLRTVNNGSITTMYAECFRGTTSLESVDIPIKLSSPHHGNYMFYQSSIQNIPNIDYSNITNAHNMFDGANLEGEVVNISLPQVLYGNRMFANTKITGIERFDAPLITSNNTDQPFVNCTELEYIRDINLPMITNANTEFTNATKLTEVSDVRYASATSCHSLFKNCNLSKVSNLYLPKVSEATSIFENNVNLTDDSFESVVLGQDSSTLNISYGFTNSQITKIPEFVDLSKVKYMQYAFDGTSYSGALVLDAPNLISAKCAFRNCNVTELTFRSETVFNGSGGDGLCNMLENNPVRIIHEYYQPNGSTNPSYEFLHMHPLWGYSRPSSSKTPVVEEIRNVNMSRGYGLSNFFSNLPNLRIVENVDCREGYINQNSFSNCPELTSITGLTIKGESETGKSLNCQAMFSNTPKLTTLEVTNAQVKPSNCQSMFNNCGITEYPSWVDVSETGTVREMFLNSKIKGAIRDFNIDNVRVLTDMGYLFQNTGITEVDGFRAMNIVNEGNKDNLWMGTGWYGPFRGCNELTRLNNIHLSVGTIYHLCNSLPSLTSVSNLYATKCYQSNYAFNSCTKLQSVSNVFIGNELTDNDALCDRDISYMFHGCSILETIENINLGKPKYANYTFHGTPNLTSNINQIQIDYSKLENMNYMYNNSGIVGDLDISLESDVRVNIAGAFSRCGLDNVKLEAKRIGYVQDLFVENPNLRTIDVSIDVLDVPSTSIHQIVNPKVGSPLESIKIHIKEINGTGYHGTTLINMSRGLNIHTVDLSGFDFNNHTVYLDNMPNLRNVKWSNTTRPLYIRNCASMGAEELNELFRSLTPPPFGYENPTVYIKGCAGADTCDVTIATKSGWTVNKTN